jgi:serine/threonine protein kinase
MIGQLRLTSGAFFARDFEVQQVMAEGGMGTVYRVLDHTCGQERALKVLLPELVADESSRRRFAQEAQIAGQLDTRHVPRIFGVGVDEMTGMPWISMELLRGRDLRRHTRERGPLPLGEAWTILEQLGQALTAAHRIGLVHRDVKPENVFLHANGDSFEVKLLDFGVAKVLDVHRMSGTGTGAIGSPLWMAPEQTMTGGRIAPATDVFAFGLVAFYTLVGRIYWRAAHDETGVTGLMRELHVEEHVLASQRASELEPGVRLPVGFDTWFQHATRRNPSERFADADRALAALRQLLTPHGRASPRSDLAFARTMVAEGSTATDVPSNLGTTTQTGDIPATDPPPPTHPQPYAQPYPSAPRESRVGWLLGLAAAGLLAAFVGAAGVWIVLSIVDPPLHSRHRAVRAPVAQAPVAPAPVAPAPVAPAPVAPPPPPTAAVVPQGYLAADQRFSGTYVCGSHIVQATLHIQSVVGSNVQATLHSMLPGEMPTHLALAGEYTVETQQLVLRASERSTPSSLDGHVDEEGMSVHGLVHGEGCQGFAFRRDRT